MSGADPAVVLLVDDQAIIEVAVRRMLVAETDLKLVHCASALDAVARALEVGPSVILQDLGMPGVDGFTLLDRYRADPALADIPVIVLSSAADPRDKSRAFAAGATDYLIKLPDRIELVARIRAQVRALATRRQRDEAYRQLERLKAQLEEKNLLLEKLSTMDALTNITNRRGFDHILDEEFRRALRDGSEIALALVDVDWFKLYNDRLGHPMGDECLRRVAQTLSAALRRAADLATRYGGEEFALILPNTTVDGARTVAEGCRAAVEALAIPHPASEIGQAVTVSVGVATIRPSVGDELAVLLAHADEALYAAKRSGRNRVVVWAPPV